MSAGYFEKYCETDVHELEKIFDQEVINLSKRRI